MGQLATIWAVRLAVGCYLGRYFAQAACEPGQRRRKLICWLWSAGCLLYLFHVIGAFAFFHGWSHQRAYAHTAEQTRELIGWNWGGGLYFNYLFTLAWLADAARLWRGGGEGDAPSGWLGWCVQLFLAFIVFNATVVFGPPFWVPIAAAFTLLLGGASVWRRRELKALPTMTSPPRDVPRTILPRGLDGLAIPVLLCTWALLLGCTPMIAADIWWHLRTGQLIIERGAVPYTDWFTFVDWDKPWIDLHWGFQLLAAGLYRLGGVPLLVLSKAVCLSLSAAIGWLACGRHLPAWAKALCWLLPLVCLSGRAVVRPEMLTLIFLTLWLWIASRLDERPRWIWWLPLIQLLWVNCHGLFVLGLAVGAIYVVDRACRQLAGGRLGLEPPPSGPSLRMLLHAGLLALLACLVNPYFEEGALFPLVLFRKFSMDQQLYASIGEFQRPADFVMRHGFWSNAYVVAQAGVWLSTAVSFLWLAWERRVSVLRLLLFASFSFLAWKASRNTSVFSLVAVFVLCSNCGDALRLRQSRRPPHAAASRSWPAYLPSAAAVLLLLGLNVSVVTNVWHEWTRDGGRYARRFTLQERHNWYAHEASRFCGKEGMPLRVFASHLGQAAVYTFHNGPQRRVFMDGRLEVSTPQTFALYLRLEQAMAHRDLRWQLVLADAEGNLPALLFDSRVARPQINGLLNTPGWRMVYADKTAAVFIDEPLAERLGLPAADPRPLFDPDAPGR